jgi:DNA-binding protein HU-beta
MNKAQLSAMLALKAEIPKVQAARYVDIVFDSIHDALVGGDKVTISDFGTFKVQERSGFKGQNPQTGEAMTVNSVRIPGFRAGKGLKAGLNPE